MNPFETIYKKNTASENLGRQIWGAMAKHWWITLIFIIFIILSILSLCKLSGDCISEFWIKLLKMEPGNKIIWLLFFTTLLLETFSICNTLTEINTLLRKENRVTWSEIAKLIALGIWIIAFVLIFNIQSNGKIAIAVGIIGAILGWVFQDRVKGATSFIALRTHHLLGIGDWIKVPNLDVDGQVRQISLTTVTLSNWDTTTSTIPISALQEGHFINLQNMVEGNTYGRRMQKTFTLDTGWIRPITEEEADCLHDKLEYFPKEEIKAGALNAHLFRLYLHHWLMNNPRISHRPNLIIRWMDQKDSGMTLQVYAFITESDFSTFEWIQSEIIEHIITSMEWFGLRLYQSPSAYDVSNSNIHIDNPEIVMKEEKR